jgi:restriction system protein
MAEIDERSIRDEVATRAESVKLVEDWLTPSGRQRHIPMFEVFIENEYLQRSRCIKARSGIEAEQKAREQLQKWRDAEIRARLNEAKEDLRQQASDMTDQAKAEQQAIRSILDATLGVDDALDWSSLREARNFQSRPCVELLASPQPPKRTFWMYLLVPLWRRKLEAYQAEYRRWQTRRKRSLEEHELQQALEHARFEKAKAEKNAFVDAFRAAYEQGRPEAIMEYTSMVFERSVYPDGFSPKHACRFDPSARTIVIDLDLPNPEEIPTMSGYKTADRNRRLEALHVKPKERDALYESAVQQTVLRTIHEVFESDRPGHVQGVVVNGYTTVTNQATGHDARSCIISVDASREKFEAIKLGGIAPAECIKGLKGVVAGPLSQVAPVQPILKFDREDNRFVESREVLGALGEETNLASIDWEEFEHLVRELFEAMFSSEDVEVRVTQASRDLGVDAVVFDPDPIRGGKFVIQAKRYTNVVPVSAVRDLYGTCMNEGASKGILVTTAHYGRDSRDFAAGKPLTLIDGSNLVYLLEQHGHRVRIDIEEAKRLAKARTAS